MEVFFAQEGMHCCVKTVVDAHVVCVAASPLCCLQFVHFPSSCACVYTWLQHFLLNPTVGNMWRQHVEATCGGHMWRTLCNTTQHELLKKDYVQSTRRIYITRFPPLIPTCNRTILLQTPFPPHKPYHQHHSLHKTPSTATCYQIPSTATCHKTHAFWC